MKSRLEFHFQANQKPNAQEIGQVAMELQLEKEVRIGERHPDTRIVGNSDRGILLVDCDNFEKQQKVGHPDRRTVEFSKTQFSEKQAIQMHIRTDRRKDF